MYKLLVAGGLISFCVQAQTFDVATVKPAVMPTPDGRGMIRMMGPTGGPGSKDPGRIHYPNMTLKRLLTSAYNVKSYQVTGPAWIDTERYDIDATMPPDTTKEQFAVMLQNLIAERFQIKLHRETKELPMYAMVVAKKTPKMKESAPVEAPPADAAPVAPPMMNGQPKFGPDGFPVMPAQMQGRPGIFQMMMPGKARLTGTQQTTKELADRLTGILDRPVNDMTGLTAKYDFTLTYNPEGLSSGMGPMPMLAPRGPAPDGGGRGGGPPQDNEPQADIFTAIQTDLGLKLEPKKGPVELIVVDSGVKTPTAN